MKKGDKVKWPKTKNVGITTLKDFEESYKGYTLDYFIIDRIEKHSNVYVIVGDQPRYTYFYHFLETDLELYEEKKMYTIDEIKKGKFAIKVHCASEWNALNTAGVTMNHNGWMGDYYYTNEGMYHSGHDGGEYYEKEGKTLLDFSQINFKGTMNKKLIGYKSPIDLFGGNIKKGSIFKALTDYTYKTDETGPTQYSKHLPKEIVETWEPVYEEEVRIGIYKAEKTLGGIIKFGCKGFSPETLKSLKSILDMRDKDFIPIFLVNGVEITVVMLDKLLKM